MSRGSASGWTGAVDDHRSYRLVREVGRGGMGIVYEAVHIPSGARRAIKFLTSSSEGAEDRVERMAREARAAATLRSVHATRVLAFGMTPERMPFIVMELLQGEDLATVLTRTRGGLAVEAAINIVRQACDAVGEAHAHGIVHRDLKPGNIFLTRGSDGRPHVKLLDFGLAKISSKVDARTSSGLVFGTPHYMSPEQLKSSTSVDARTDVWALGVILCQLVYGILPFDGQNVSQVIASILTAAPELPANAGVPTDLRRIIARCLAKKARSRYRDARELAGELDRLSTSTTNAHDCSGVTPRPWALEPRESMPSEVHDRELAGWGGFQWAAAVVGCLMMLVTGILTSSLGRSRAPAAPPPMAVEALPPPTLTSPPVLAPARPLTSASPALSSTSVPTVPARASNLHRPAMPRRVDHGPASESR